MARLAPLCAFLVPALLAAAPAGAAGANDEAAFLAAWNTIRGADLAAHIRTLASDDFGGRAPGTEGEEKTLAYLEREFARLGAQPYSPAGWLQEVPLAEVTLTGTPAFSVRDAKGRRALKPAVDFVARAGRPTTGVDLVDVPVVFAGFGVTAPEYGWDDYAGTDLAGAAVLLLRGEPGSAADSTLFLGRGLTVHALPQTKARNAARHGARLSLTVHTDSSAGHPFTVLSGGGLGTTQMFLAEDSRLPALEAGVHLNEQNVRTLVARAGFDFDDLVARARRPGFRPIPLGTTVSLKFGARSREIVSHNVIAKFEGSGAPDEAVVYTAHWDHVGTNPSLPGDKIFNGAVDNATGTAGLLELAEAFAALPQKPRRTVYLVATTSEEKGLLGAEYLSRHPIVPLAQIVAVLNMDALFPFASFRAMAVPGYGSSEVEDVLADAARRVDRVLLPDDAPEVGAYYRSDHYPFAEKGVPAVFAVGNPLPSQMEADSALAGRFLKYLQSGYHKPADEFDAATWEMAGIEEDVRVYFEMGWRLAEDTRFPNWRYGNQFRALRDAMRQAAVATAGGRGTGATGAP